MALRKAAILKECPNPGLVRLFGEAVTSKVNGDRKLPRWSPTDRKTLQQNDMKRKPLKKEARRTQRFTGFRLMIALDSLSGKLDDCRTRYSIGYWK